MELGVYTFGDLTPDPETGRTVMAGKRCFWGQNPLRPLLMATVSPRRARAGPRRAGSVALEPVQIKQRGVSDPAPPEPLFRSGNGCGIALPLRRLEEPEASPAIVRGGLQAGAEDLLSSFGLAPARSRTAPSDWSTG